MKRLALVSVSLVLIAAGAASAGYSTTGSSGEVSTLEIFRNIYGAGMNGNNWCGTTYTNGTITATRVEDYNDPYSQPGTPGDNLYLLSTSFPTTATDQLWIDGVATVTARARYAGNQQQLGYDDGSGYVEILDIGDNTGFIDISTGPVFFPPGTTWRWVREGSGVTWYSTEDDNSDDLDHLITYYVTGLNNGEVTWVVFWDDQAGGGDRDFNDFVLVITCVTIVPNIVGQTKPDANSAIIDVGLTVGTITEECNDTIAAGLVLSQDPAAGTAAAVGSAVNYVVSSGPCTRTLMTSSSVGGSVTVPGEPGPYTYSSGEDANIVATPDTGYHFVNWTGTSVDAGKVADPNSASTTITMDDDYAVHANFAINTYTLTVNNGTGSGTYDHNETVPISADEPPAGSHFTSWTGDTNDVEDVNSSSTNIVMLGDAEVTANFAINTYTLTVNNGTGSGTYDHNETVPISADAPPAGYHFTSWSGDTENVADANSASTTITMLGNATVTATFTQEQYTLTINVVGDGSVIKDPNQATYTYGQDVNLTAVADAGWTFSEWSGDLTGSTNPDTITIDGNKNVTATFTQEQYTLTINVVGDGSVIKDPNQATYTYGQDVNLTAVADAGWTFSEWSGDLTGSTNPDTITMDGSKTVTATFTQEQYTLTINVVGDGSVIKDPNQATYTYGQDVNLTAVADAGWTFSEWSGDLTGSTNPDTLTMNGSKTVTATFTQEQYTLTINVVGDGSVIKDPNQATYTYGQDVNLTAVADAGWTFSEWSGDLTGSTNPDTLTMNGSKTVTATFTQEQYTLTINVVGDGSVIKDPNQATYTYGQDVNLTAVADAGWTFSEWSGDLTGSTNPDTLTMNGSKTVTATFTQEQYTLTINVVGDGSVIKDPNQATYTYGQDVNLTAVADAGWTFSEWSGDLTGSTNPDTITMDGSKTVTATFTQEQYTLTINVVGDGSVIKDPNQATYTYGQDVNLTAVADAGWTFSEWSGDLTGSTNPDTITMDGSKTVTATFTQEQYTLTINVVGDGSVIKDPNQATYTYGQDVNLTAVADAGWTFSEWSGDLTGSTNPDTITMDGSKTVTATFTQEQYTLTINVVGDGSVIKDPNQATYTYGQDVNLTAVADAGWTFSEWSGDLTGSTNPDTITMDGSKTVTATFTQEQYTLTINVVGDGSVIKDPNQATYTYGQDVNLTAVADAGWTFSEWSGDLTGSTNPDTITMDGSKTVTATFTQEQYTLTINVVGDGSVIKDPNQATYTYGQDVNLTAVADAGWTFSEWSGDLTGSTNPDTITMDGSKTVTATFTQEQYTLTINVVGDGSVIKDPNQATYTYGQDVNLTAVADAGWTFSEWSGDLTGSTNPDTITMDGSKTVTATFTQEQYTLTINVVGDGSVIKDPNQATYTYGQDVNLTAVADAGWTFSEWSGDLTGSTNPDTITMDGSKTVTATFTQEQYTLTINVVGDGSVIKDPNQATYTYGQDVNLTAVADAGWTFSEWSGDLTGSTNPDTITMDGSKTVTATFTQEQYTLTINVVGDGSVIKDPNQATYTYGQDVNLTAVADAGWTFSEWSGDLTGSTNPDTITIDGNKNVTATFTQEQYTLTINVVGDGSVIKDPNQATYTYGQDVNLTAVADAGWTFSEWSGDLTGSTNPDTITMDGSKTVTATFTQEQYTLTINVVGDGSVIKDPNQATYTYGQDVNLTAVADAGWTFSEWSGDLTGSTNPDTITMDGSKTVTATFTQEQYTLTINVVGDGSVIKDPNQATYTYGQDVNLTAVADAGWTFSEWSGDLTGSTNPDTITMDGSKTVTATFTQEQYTLTINVVGDGSVIKDPNQATYTYGQDVNLTAVADAGWTFSEWSGDLTGSTNPDTITMDGSKTVTATFTQEQYTLTINVVGDGSVIKDPNQATYTYGQDVNLTAVADAGWTFSEWSGDLTGSTNPDTITMDGSKTVTATFTQEQYTLTINVVGDGSVIKDPNQATYTYGQDVNLTAVADAGWTFSEWSGDLTGSTNPDTITIDGNKNVTATFTQEQYTLTINVVGDGSVIKDPNQATYTYGQDVNLTAVADAGWTFSEWSGDLTGSTNPDTITMDGSKTVTATFTQEQYTLTINVVGDGSVIKDPNQATYTYGQDVNLTAVADAGWTFSEWSGDLTGSTNPDTITMDGSKTVTATFTQEQYTLTINVVGDGSVIKDPNQATYTYGQDVNLTAVADAGWTFSEWSGDLTGSTNPDTITMDGSKTVTATFTQEQYTLTINVVGDGSVIKDPNQATYTYGQDVNLTAVADAGWTFSEWSGDLTGSTNPDTITMDGSKTVTATFTQEQYTLTINVVGDGSVIKDPNQATYTYGQDVNLTAVADAGWTFSEWSGDLTGSTNPDTITMDGSKTVTATFTINQHNLTTSSTRGGSVTIPGEPGPYDYNDGQVVPIVATADAGCHFVNWTGDVANVNDIYDPCTTITMYGNYIVEANFALNQHTLDVNSTSGGSVVVPGEGQFIYSYGLGRNLNAEAETGYHFVEWTGDINTVAEPCSASTAIIIYGDYSITANFAINTYTLTVNNGTGSGTYDHNETVPISADAPPAGSHFTGWTGDTNDVEDVNSSSTNIVMLGDAEVTANFAANQYTVTATSGPNGFVDPNGAVDANHGDDLTFEATPDSGYEVDIWTVDGETVQSGGGSYTLHVNANHTVKVTFKQAMPGGVYVWTYESPYSMLWIDPLNWDPLGVPGEGDTAIVNPLPYQGPVVEHDMSVGYIDGSRWTDGEDRWNIGNERFEQYPWDFDSNQIMKIVDGDISIGEWNLSGEGSGTSLIEIGLHAGSTWGEPNITIGELGGLQSGTVVFDIGGSSTILGTDDWEFGKNSEANTKLVFNLFGDANVVIDGKFYMGEYDDYEGPEVNETIMTLSLSDNASLTVKDLLRTPDEWGEGYVYISDNASLDVCRFKGGDGEDGWLEFVMTGGTFTAHDDWCDDDEGEFLLGDDGSGLVDISGGVFTAKDIVFGVDDDDSVGTFNISGTAEVVCDGLKLADGDGTAIMDMTSCDAHVTVEDRLGLPASNDATWATINLHGGLLEVGEIYHESDNWTIDICGCGVMVIDGDVVDDIWDDYDAGNITVCGFGPCGGNVTLMVDHNNPDFPGDRTKVWAEVDPNRASDPDPPCGEECGGQGEKVSQDVCLSWTPGASAEQHFIFLHTNEEKVCTGDLSALVATLPAEQTTYCPGPLELGATYWWRVDEVGGDYGTVPGGCWCFDVVDCMIVEDMESYDESCGANAVWEVWKDGAGDCNGIGGNGTGSSVWLAYDPVHGGDKSMEYQYDNKGTERECGWSEATKQFDPPLNLVDNFEKAMVLWFYGYANNMTESMWVVLSDGTTDAQSVYGVLGDDPDNIKVEDWMDWNIDVQDQFGSINLGNVESFSIGFGERSECGEENPGNPVGTVFFDDISLCTTICVPKYAPDGDINDDCVVDWEDLLLMLGEDGDNWLEDRR